MRSTTCRLPESLVKQIEQYWKAQFVGLKG